MSAIVLFDGVCNFCNGAVNFVIEHDRGGYFKFAPLQSELGIELRSKFGISQADTDSVVLVQDEKAYLHSTAALRIGKRLDGIWSWTYIFIIVPRPIRDWAYRTFAKYRYRLFGRQEACMLPTADVRSRFL